jgi:hypothetical protein
MNTCVPLLVLLPEVRLNKDPSLPSSAALAYASQMYVRYLKSQRLSKTSECAVSLNEWDREDLTSSAGAVVNSVVNY